MRILSIIVFVAAVVAVLFFIMIKTPRGAPVPHVDLPNADKTFRLTLSFPNGTRVPDENTCAGLDQNPKFDIKNVPQNAQSLAILVDDHNTDPSWTHWIVWNIPAIDQVLPVGGMPVVVTQGKNDFGRIGYNGPCPPHGAPMHTYVFSVLALDNNPSLWQGSPRADFDKMIAGHVIAIASSTGTYARQ